MNRPLRHVAIVVTVMFAFLFGSTTFIQAITASSLDGDNRNVRTLYREFGRDRGPIVVDGDSIADSTKVDDSYGYQRRYLNGPLYAPLTGFFSVVYGRSELEQAMNEQLSGTADALFYQRMSDLVAGKVGQGASVELTIDPKVQQAAYDAIGDRRGAAVALDPRSGNILAMVSKPSYDPNRLAGHNTTEVTKAWKDLTNDPNRPMVNRAISGNLYPPGSTFKLITAAAAIEQKGLTKDSVIPGPASFTLPNTTNVLPNDDKQPCGPGNQSTLAEALRKSCNTSFAKLGLSIGQDALRTQAKKFGFEEPLAIPLTVTPSSIAADMNKPELAQSSIGQFEDKVSPLQMAMVSAAIGNDGVLMKPNLIRAVRTASLKEVDAPKPKEIGRSVSTASAAQLTSMMEDVVKSGTGTRAQLPGIEVAGKTGTAEWKPGKFPHAWFTAFAPAKDPQIAVAVVIEEGGNVGRIEGDGGHAAAPVARAMMKARLSP